VLNGAKIGELLIGFRCHRTHCFISGYKSLYHVSSKLDKNCDHDSAEMDRDDKGDHITWSMLCYSITSNHSVVTAS